MSTPTPTDTELVARAAAGDRWAFTAIYRRHVDAVHDHVGRWSEDAALAADATAAAFTALLDHVGDLRGETLLGWLLATARHRAAHRLPALADADRPTPPGAAAEPELRAPMAVHRAVQDAIEARFAPGPVSRTPSARTIGAGALALLLLTAIALRPPPSPAPVPTALATPLGVASPAPTPEPTPTGGTPTPGPTPTPSAGPTVGPTTPPTPGPTESPSPGSSPTPATFTVAIAAPVDGASLPVTSTDASGRHTAAVNASGTVTGLDPARATVRWTSDQRPGVVLLDRLTGTVVLEHPKQCAASLQVLTLAVTDTVTGTVRTDTVAVEVTDRCPAPVVRLVEPSDGTRVTAPAGQVDQQGRPYARVRVLAEEDDGRLEGFTYDWRSDRAPSTSLATGRSGTVDLWTEGCATTTHVLTVTITDTSTGRSGTDSVRVTVVPECPTVP